MPRPASEKSIKKARAASGEAVAAPDMRSTVQSLAKGFRVLEAFTADEPEMTLSDVCASTGLDPGTTHRMLNTLVALGYVARAADGKRFRLSLKVLDLGFHAIGHQDLRAIVRPYLRDLVGSLGEAASFGVLEGSDVLYIERVRAGAIRLGVDIRVGTTLPAHISAIGQSILAFLNANELAQVAGTQASRGHPYQDKRSVTEIMPELRKIRKMGYALTPSSLTEGLQILAVPVLDPDGHPVGAISIAAPAARATLDEFEAMALEPLRDAARNIARALEAGGSIGFSH
jgi:IclR family transcriptional regulator, pca regulon regulatory protein